MTAILLVAVVGGLFLPGADDQPYQPEVSESAPVSLPVYLVGPHPLHNPQHLFEVYQPVIDYLNARLPGVRLELEASRSYAVYDGKLLKERKFHFAMPNPKQTVEATAAGYRVFGKMSDEDPFRGLVIVRTDSGIRTVGDLKGKTVSYPAPTALAATMMPQYYLHSHGLDVRTDIRNLYVGSQESSIMSVYLGTSAAGATWPGPWKLFVQAHPDYARMLEVRWETPPLPNNGWVVRGDVPPELARRFAELLFGLPDSAEGRALMAAVGVARFEPADDATYQPVRTFLDRYRETIGPVPEP
ncbi:MAG: phosphate/phosphite/phosphonate ABC transporter substrate-binding protein [Rhodospirillaceae bacterium]